MLGVRGVFLFRLLFLLVVDLISGVSPEYLLLTFRLLGTDVSYHRGDVSRFRTLTGFGASLAP
jgi:hypothetical protein